MAGSRASDRGPIDWAQIKQRLARVDEALAQAHAPTPQQRRALLEARARALADLPAAPVEAGSGIDVISFAIGEQRYAVDAPQVREVRTLDALTPIPCTPTFVSGMINAHGRILAVIDLKRFLELPESGLSDLNKVIILHQGDLEFGLLADRIIGAERVPLAQLQPPDPSAHGPRFACLRGITPEGLVVLDAPRLMAQPGLLIEDEVLP
ncbi:MAG TPA: chemotaxis protein CheW [Albitalea sp.]|nr:chemotaxis protein CheW [Albitalea sp.]